MIATNIHYTLAFFFTGTTRASLTPRLGKSRSIKKNKKTKISVYNSWISKDLNYFVSKLCLENSTGAPLHIWRKAFKHEFVEDSSKLFILCAQPRQCLSAASCHIRCIHITRAQTMFSRPGVACVEISVRRGLHVHACTLTGTALKQVGQLQFRLDGIKSGQQLQTGR